MEQEAPFLETGSIFYQLSGQASLSLSVSLKPTEESHQYLRDQQRHSAKHLSWGWSCTWKGTVTHPLGRGHKPRSFCPVLFLPIDRDWVQESRAETLFFDQGMEKGELHFRATSVRLGGAFRIWGCGMEWLNSLRHAYFFCCSWPFCTWSILYMMPHLHLGLGAQPSPFCRRESFSVPTSSRSLQQV